MASKLFWFILFKKKFMIFVENYNESYNSEIFKSKTNLWEIFK